MAKFAIALCILLAACGAQADSTSQSAISSLIETIEKEVEAKKEELEAAIANTAEAMVIYEEQWNSMVQDTITEWQEKIDELVAQYDNVSSCVSSNTDLEASADAVVSNTTACTQDYADQLNSSYIATIAAMETFTSELADVTVKAEDCASNLLTYISCMASLYESDASSITEEWKELVESTATLLADASKAQDTIANCASTAGWSTLVAEAQEYYNTVEECINNLNSTSS